MSAVIDLGESAAAAGKRGFAGASDAGLDAAAWAQLAEATTVTAFGQAWLVLTARSAQTLRHAALLLGPPDGAAFEPVARWSLRPDSEGGMGFIETVKPVLEAAMRTRRPALEGVGRTDLAAGEGSALIAYPILLSGALHGIVLAEAGALDTAAARRLVRHFQWSSGWVEAFLRRGTSGEADTVRERAFALLHTVEAVAAAPRLRNASRVFAGLLADRFGCDLVAVTRFKSKKNRVVALNQTAVFDRRSRQGKALAAAADEAVDQGTTLTAPADPDRQPFVMAAQDALSRTSDRAYVLTVPLVSRGEPFGALVLLRPARPYAQEEVDLLDALGTGVAPLLAEKAEADRGLLALIYERTRSGLGKLFGAKHLGLKLAVLAALAIGTALALATQEYRLRGRSEVQGETRRMLAAPFDGYVKTARARAGDVIDEGTVLAELLDNDIVLDRLRHLSRKRQYQLELDRALAKRDLAGTQVARAQVAQADADLELSEQMLARAQLKAPFDAVVVTGDLSQSIGKPVSRGDVLFEIAPLDRYRITVVVPESEIRLVQTGMRGEVLLSALPEKPFPFEIRSVTPVARVSEGVNGFEVIGMLSERDERIRPGMEGVAKIAAGERSVFWVWTHPFWHWLRVKAWSLIP